MLYYGSRKRNYRTYLSIIFLQLITFLIKDNKDTTVAIRTYWFYAIVFIIYT